MSFVKCPDCGQSFPSDHEGFHRSLEGELCNTPSHTVVQIQALTAERDSLRGELHEARAENDLAWDAARIPVRTLGVALPEVVGKLRAERDAAQEERGRLRAWVTAVQGFVGDDTLNTLADWKRAVADLSAERARIGEVTANAVAWEQYGDKLRKALDEAVVRLSKGHLGRPRANDVDCDYCVVALSASIPIPEPSAGSALLARLRAAEAVCEAGLAAYQGRPSWQPAPERLILKIRAALDVWDALRAREGA